MKKSLSLLLLIIFTSCVTVPEDELLPEDEDSLEEESSPSWINFNPFGSKNKP